MNEITTCAVAADGERIHRYVAGTLEPSAVAEFETHLLGCAECQAAVREGANVAAALRRTPVGMRPIPVRGRRAFWAVPLAAAAAGALLLVAVREAPIVRLGRVSDAPPFAGVPVRGDADSLSRLADSGMTAYAAGHYREAARLLAAVPAEQRTPGLAFYLGVTALLAGSPGDAVRWLAEVPSQSPYAAEARFYRAKAWLRLGAADSALTQLAAVAPDGAIAARAAALVDSVRRVHR